MLLLASALLNYSNNVLHDENRPQKFPPIKKSNPIKSLYQISN